MTPVNVATQLAEAGSLMLVGMAVVFVFLTILIAAVNGLTWFCQTFLENTNNTSTPNTESSSSAFAGVPKEHVAAISAAIEMHHKN